MTESARNDPAVSARTVRKACLGEMEGCWLEARCGQCSAMALIPIRLLIRQRGPHVPVGALLPRLTCRRCKVPPAAVWLNETPHRAADHGVTPGWSVLLIPDGSDDPA